MASPNTLTNLIPTMYAALDTVSRERMGFIHGVSRNSTADAVTINQTLNVPVVQAVTSVNITPGNISPDTGGKTLGNVAVTITNQKAVPFAWTGDEEVQVSQTGAFDTVISQNFQQAFRTLSNEIENDLAGLHVNASRAFGAAGTVPFNTAGDLSDLAETYRILDDNGAPDDIQTILGSAAIAKLRGKQSSLFKINEAGTEDLLRRGVIGQLENTMIRLSGQVRKNVTAGTSAGSTTNAAGYAVGAVTITLASAGTGAIIAGDIITFAGDLNKYVVLTGDTNVADGGTIVLQEPGLQQVIVGATAITMVAAVTRNMMFSRSAILLATRVPYRPKSGDQAEDVTFVTDPVSGLTFEVALYPQYRQVHIEVSIAWGVKAIQNRHIALIIGS